jgi:hypothetical protein
MMKSIKEKWEKKRRSEINPYENTRHQPDSFVSFQLNRPPFHAFGNGNTHPITCNNFLVSHNVGPQSYPNRPRAPQVYNTVVHNMARRSIEQKQQLAKQLKLEKKKVGQCIYIHIGIYVYMYMHGHQGMQVP